MDTTSLYGLPTLNSNSGFVLHLRHTCSMFVYKWEELDVFSSDSRMSWETRLSTPSSECCVLVSCSIVFNIQPGLEFGVTEWTFHFSKFETKVDMHVLYLVSYLKSSELLRQLINIKYRIDNNIFLMTQSL